MHGTESSKFIWFESYIETTDTEMLGIDILPHPMKK